MLIDLDKACAWLEENTHKYIYDSEVSRYNPPRLAIGGKCWEHFRKAMSNSPEFEGIKTCNSNKNLQELTWQDVKRIWEVGMDAADYNSYHNIPIEDEAFYREVLKRYREESK